MCLIMMYTVHCTKNLNSTGKQVRVLTWLFTNNINSLL